MDLRIVVHVAPSFEASKVKTQGNRGAIRTVVIDDSAQFLSSLGELVSQCGRLELVGCARSASEGIGLVERVHPDLVLMDLLMPGMNGLEATRRIARSDGLPRVVMMSVHQSAELARTSLEAGADAFVHKRDLWDELHRSIGRWFPAAGGGSP
jgi:DNA-binding NarL/FixJ family response regulator